MTNQGNKLEAYFSYLCKRTAGTVFWRHTFHGSDTGSSLNLTCWPPHVLRLSKGNTAGRELLSRIHPGLCKSTVCLLTYFSCRILTLCSRFWQFLVLPSLWASISKFFLAYNTLASHSALDSAFLDFELSPHYKFYLQFHPQVLITRSPPDRIDMVKYSEMQQSYSEYASNISFFFLSKLSQIAATLTHVRTHTHTHLVNISILSFIHSATLPSGLFVVYVCEWRWEGCRVRLWVPVG